MPVSVHPDSGTIETLLGTVSTNIVSYQSEIKFVFVKAETSTTVFDVTFTDIFNNVIFQRLDITGELNEQMCLPGYGNLTLTIANATVDEEFNYVISIVK
jgi:hypothetical protein